MQLNEDKIITTITAVGLIVAATAIALLAYIAIFKVPT